MPGGPSTRIRSISSRSATMRASSANLGNQLSGVVLRDAERSVDQRPEGGSPFHPHPGLVVDEGYGLQETHQRTDTASLAGKGIHHGDVFDANRSSSALLSTRTTQQTAVNVDPRASTRPERLDPDVLTR